MSALHGRPIGVFLQGETLDVADAQKIGCGLVENCILPMVKMCHQLESALDRLKKTILLLAELRMNRNSSSQFVNLL